MDQPEPKGRDFIRARAMRIGRLVDVEAPDIILMQEYLLLKKAMTLTFGEKLEETERNFGKDVTD